jgi:hypothetical protein
VQQLEIKQCITLRPPRNVGGSLQDAINQWCVKAAGRRAEIVAELEAMVSMRLFGHHQWPAERETVFAALQRFKDLGLVRSIPGQPDTWQDTPLGKEVDVGLFGVFIGLIDLWNVPIILQYRRLINESESGDIYEQMSRKVNPESILMEYVRRAYFDSRKASNFLH